MLNLALVCSFSAKGSSHIAISVWLENNQQPFWLGHTTKEAAPCEEAAQEVAAESGEVQKHERPYLAVDRDLNRFFKEWKNDAGWGMWSEGSAGRNEFRKRGWMNKMVGLLGAMHLGHEERVQELLETPPPCDLYVSK